jgi:hypothetical protein
MAPSRHRAKALYDVVMRLFWVISLLLVVDASGASAGDFWKRWADGKAEVSGYALTEPRYGHLRSGSLVLIFVTEDFSDTLRVKADPGRHPQSDVYPVLKLNAIRHFQTGIYDYSVMSSTFVKTDFDPLDPFPLVKTSFSAQEWCGHVYVQWLRHGSRLLGDSHSYFDGEADSDPKLDIPKGAVFEDALPILLRGLRGDYLAAGERRTVPFLPSTIRSRFSHQPQKFGQATIERGKEPVDFNRRRAIVYTVTVKEPPLETHYYVEGAPPRRLLGWTRSDGEKATLLGTKRLAYWQMNGPGGENALSELGLVPVERTLAPAVRGGRKGE